jgi:hypothetical protein
MIQNEVERKKKIKSLKPGELKGHLTLLII